jgi:prepilin-type N-terminal cleavage/methylation domain-containing protein
MRGTTLVEVLIAVLVFAIGALAFAGSWAVVLRGGRAAYAAADGAVSANTRMARLAARQCASLAPGSDTRPSGVTETWSVHSSSPGTALARIELRFPRRSTGEDIEVLLACG